MMIKLDEYLNNIDLECNSKNNIISIKAYQLDNKGRGSATVRGIKDKLKVDGIKSCDYFLESDEKIFIVEISNFFKQLEDLRETYNKIKKLNIKNLKLIKNYMSPENIIKSEIKNKYLNTLLILNYFNFVNVQQKKKVYFLVFCEENKDLTILFDKIQRELRNDLKVLIDDIKIILKNDFEYSLNKILNTN